MFRAVWPVSRPAARFAVLKTGPGPDSWGSRTAFGDDRSGTPTQLLPITVSPVSARNDWKCALGAGMRRTTTKSNFGLHSASPP